MKKTRFKTKMEYENAYGGASVARYRVVIVDVTFDQLKPYLEYEWDMEEEYPLYRDTKHAAAKAFGVKDKDVESHGVMGDGYGMHFTYRLLKWEDEAEQSLRDMGIWKD